TARCWRAARRGRPVAARCRVSRADEEVGSVSEGSRPSGAGARTARLPCDADRTLAAVLLRTGLMGRPHKTGESARVPRRSGASRPPTDADRVLEPSQETVLDVLDHLLNKGVMLNGDVTLGVAGIDLIYL